VSTDKKTKIKGPLFEKDICLGAKIAY